LSWIIGVDPTQQRLSHVSIYCKAFHGESAH
jgi:hypothetical protein